MADAQVKEFDVTDLYLAVYLECIGYKIVKLENISHVPLKVAFVFIDKTTTEQRRKDIEAFRGNTALVSPRTYSETLKNLKARVIDSKQ